MTRQPVLIAFVVLGLGVTAGDALAGGPTAAVLMGIVAAVAAATLVVAWRARSGVALAALVCVSLTGAWSAALRDVPGALEPQCGTGEARWRGTIDDVVERAVDSVTGRLGQRTVLTDLWERCEDGWRGRPGRASVTLRDGATVARGDRIELTLLLEPLGDRRNPVGPDPRMFARRERLAARAIATSPHAHLAWGQGPLAVLDRSRARAAQRFEDRFSRPLAALAKALSLGDQASIDDATRERWSDAGVAHLLSISGLHVALVAWLVYGLAFAVARAIPPLVERWSARRAAALLTLPTVLVFCAWTGASAPALRATLMAGAYLAGLAIGRPSSAINALGAAGVVLLLVDPTSIYDPGFLMSFVAVAALLWLPSPRPAQGVVKRAGRWLGATVIASLAATLATAPITAYHFGYVSVVAPLTNVVAVPIGNLVVTPVALVYSIAAPLAEWIDVALAAVLRLALGAVDLVATYGAALPWSTVSLPPPSALEVIAYFVALVGGVASVRVRRLRVVVLAAAVALAASILWRAVSAGSDGELHVIHPYVGQGDAAIVQLPEGGVMLFDAGGAIDPGGWDPGRNVIAPMLRRLGVRRIDVAVVSHPDPDHLGGMHYLAERFPIDELWWPGTGLEEARMRDVMELVRASGGRLRTIDQLPRRHEREGVILELLHPWPPAGDSEGLPYYPALTDNDNSMVLRLSHGERSVILPGDVEADGEALVIGPPAPASGVPAPASGVDVRAADVLKAPHHGSRTSSSDAFLDALKPRAIVISCGAGNRFGFPSPEVLARYSARGIAVLRTDLDGAIHMRSDGRRWRIESYRGARLELP